MANRDLGISICGVVVGVLIGAGSVLFTQDAALGTVTSVAYRGQETHRERADARAYNARNVEKSHNEQSASNPAKFKAPRMERNVEDTEVHEAAPVVTYECDIAQSIADKVSPFIPNEQDEQLGNIRNALAGAVAMYCQ